jgi:hypothetical protein
MFDMEKWTALSFSFAIGDFNFEKEAGTPTYIIDDVECEVLPDDTLGHAYASLIMRHINYG